MQSHKHGFEDVAARPLNLLDIGTEQLQEPRFITPLSSAFALTVKPEFGPVFFIMEAEAKNQTDPPLMQAMKPPKRVDGQVDSQEAPSSFVWAEPYPQVRNRKDMMHYGPGMLYGVLARLGPIQKVLGSFNFSWVGRTPYIVLWLPKTITRCQHNVIAHLRAEGMSDEHKKYRELAHALVTNKKS